MHFSSAGAFPDLHASFCMADIVADHVRLCGALSTTAGLWDHCELAIITRLTKKHLSAFVWCMRQSMLCLGLFL